MLDFILHLCLLSCSSSMCSWDCLTIRNRICPRGDGLSKTENEKYRMKSITLSSSSKPVTHMKQQSQTLAQQALGGSPQAGDRGFLHDEENTEGFATLQQTVQHTKQTNLCSLCVQMICDPQPLHVCGLLCKHLSLWGVFLPESRAVWHILNKWNHQVWRSSICQPCSTLEVY